jgi:hypothetical protein
MCCLRAIPPFSSSGGSGGVFYCTSGISGRVNLFSASQWEFLFSAPQLFIFLPFFLSCFRARLIHTGCGKAVFLRQGRLLYACGARAGACVRRFRQERAWVFMWGVDVRAWSHMCGGCGLDRALAIAGYRDGQTLCAQECVQQRIRASAYVFGSPCAGEVQGRCVRAPVDCTGRAFYCDGRSSTTRGRQGRPTRHQMER